jgi:hypothetical protein
LESTSTRASSWPGASLYKSLKLGWHWRQLKLAAVAASEAAQAHEANGVPAGSKEYRLLYEQVHLAITKYRQVSGEDVDLIKARLPVISVLEKLATTQPPVSVNRRSLVFVVAGLSVAATVLLSFLIGFGEGIVHFIAHLFGA